MSQLDATEVEQAIQDEQAIQVKQDGGKLINNGRYGCIFLPQLLCNTAQPEFKTDRKHPLISKIIYKDDAFNEFNIGKKIRSIALWKNYFSVSESICLPANRQTDKDIKQCEVFNTEKLENLRILSMRYNGVSLLNARFNVNTFDIMRFVTHLLEGTALMTVHGIIHRDIHSANIIVDSYNVPRLIDFNLSILDYTKYTPNILFHQYSPKFTQISPDYMIMNALYQSKKTITSDTVINDILYKSTIIKQISRLLGVSLDTIRSQLNDIYSASIVEYPSISAWFDKFWPTLDSWAIGANIIQLILHMSKWPAFISKLNENKHILYPVLRGLCAINPKERMNCMQALYKLNPANRIVSQYGKGWLYE